jgi:V/A-type H+-transporting ATPase subunit C
MILPLVFLLLGALFLIVFLDARRTFPYVYCNAMISAWEGRMLDSKRLVELSEMDTQGILSALSGTDFEGLELGEAMEMEGKMRERCVAKYREICLNLPAKGRRFFELLLERFELYNLKSLLTSLHTGLPPRFLPSPLSSKERLQLLSQVKTLENLLDFLKGTHYGEILLQSLEGYKKKGLPFLLRRLDQHYYQKLWGEAQKQRRSVRELVGVEIDLVNIKLLVRLKREGVPPEEIRELLIKPSYLIPAHLLDQMAAAEDLPALLQMLSDTPYGEAVSRISQQVQATGSLYPLEKEIEEGFLRLCKWYSSADFFSLAPAVCFFYMKEAELRNLRALLRLRAAGIQPAEVREMVVFHEV